MYVCACVVYVLCMCVFNTDTIISLLWTKDFIDGLGFALAIDQYLSSGMCILTYAVFDYLQFLQTYQLCQLGYDTYCGVGMQG